MNALGICQIRQSEKSPVYYAVTVYKNKFLTHKTSISLKRYPEEQRCKSEQFIYNDDQGNDLEYPSNILIEVMKIHRFLGQSDLLIELISKIDRLAVLKSSDSLSYKIPDLKFLEALAALLHMRKELPEVLTHEFVIDERVHMLFALPAINVFHIT